MDLEARKYHLIKESIIDTLERVLKREKEAIKMSQQNTRKNLINDLKATKTILMMS